MAALAVTVVTPSYNQAAYLEDALRSVLAQDYPRLEYIVVDGASTDGSVEIIQKYAPQLSYWVSEPDHGQAEAINKGFTRASGEILAWLNSDDLYLPGAIRQAVKIFKDHPEVGLAFGDALSIDAHGNPLKHLQGRPWGLLDLMAFRILTQPTVFIRREALEKAGFLDTSYHFMLDHHLWVRIALEFPILYAGLPQRNGHHPSTNSFSTSLQDSPLWAATRHHPAAKNVAQAAGFQQEIIRMVEWMRQHPSLSKLFQQHRRKILGGAYRLSGRYLLDGGLPSEALRSYLKAFKYDPLFALKHTHRMSYAFLKIVRINSLFDLWLDTRNRHNQHQLIKDLRAFSPPLSGSTLSWEGWPGLQLMEPSTHEIS